MNNQPYNFTASGNVDMYGSPGRGQANYGNSQFSNPNPNVHQNTSYAQPAYNTTTNYGQSSNGFSVTPNRPPVASEGCCCSIM